MGYPWVGLAPFFLTQNFPLLILPRIDLVVDMIIIPHHALGLALLFQVHNVTSFLSLFLALGVKYVVWNKDYMLLGVFMGWL